MTKWGSMLDSHIDKGAGMNWEDRAYLDGWTYGAKRCKEWTVLYGDESSHRWLRLSALQGWVQGCCGMFNLAPYPRGMRDAALSAFGLV